MIDPQTEHDELWVDFVKEPFSITNSDQYVCFLTVKQVKEIMDSNTSKIDVEEEVSDYVNKFYEGSDQR